MARGWVATRRRLITAWPQLLIPAIGGAFLALSLGFNLLVPPFEGFDEVWHLHYVEYVVSHGAPPIIGIAYSNPEAAQPPAFYYLEAQILKLPRMPRPLEPSGFADSSDKPGAKYHHSASDLCIVCGAERSLHAMRFLSALIALITIAVAAILGRMLFPGWPAMWVAAAGGVAFEPQFLSVDSLINNDSLSFALGALVLLGCCGVVVADRSNVRTGWVIAIGFALGADFLTKEYAFTLLPLPVIALCLSEQSIGRRLRSLGVVAGISATVCSAWLIRNQLLYGQPWPFRAEFANIQRNLPQTVWTGPAPLSYFQDVFPGEFFQSFWYSGGFGQIRWPAVAYEGFAWLIVASAIGILLAFRRRLVPPGWWRVGSLLLAAVILDVAGTLYSNLTIHNPQGRYLFPALPGIALLMGLGLAGLTPGRWSRWAPLGIPAIFLLASVGTLALVVFPNFWVKA